MRTHAGYPEFQSRLDIQSVRTVVASTRHSTTTQDGRLSLARDVVSDLSACRSSFIFELRRSVGNAKCRQLKRFQEFLAFQ
jgi:hypothetical protein